jgi:hypothetical protein
MLNELAHFSLNIALGFAVLGTIIPLLGATLRRSSWMQLASVFATLQFLLVAFAFGVLTLAFVTSDFSLRLVVLNSHTLKPMIYKIAGVWGNHEGSLLLWVLILTFFAACAAIFGRRLPQSLLARVLGVQSAITTAFLAFVLLTSNPFTRVASRPLMGRGSIHCCKIPVWRFTRRFYISDMSAFRSPSRLPLRVAGRQSGFGLGALGAALDLGGLDFSDHRHRAWQLVGLL